MTKDRTHDDGALTALDRTAGELLSWVAGRTSVCGGRGRVDGALGTLLSWTGLVATARRRGSERR